MLESSAVNSRKLLGRDCSAYEDITVNERLKSKIQKKIKKIKNKEKRKKRNKKKKIKTTKTKKKRRKTKVNSRVLVRSLGSRHGVVTWPPGVENRASVLSRHQLSIGRGKVNNSPSIQEAKNTNHEVDAS